MLGATWLPSPVIRIEGHETIHLFLGTKANVFMIAEQAFAVT